MEVLLVLLIPSVVGLALIGIFYGQLKKTLSDYEELRSRREQYQPVKAKVSNVKSHKEQERMSNGESYVNTIIDRATFTYEVDFNRYEVTKENCGKLFISPLNKAKIFYNVDNPSEILTKRENPIGEIVCSILWMIIGLASVCAGLYFFVVIIQSN